jgi:hypothetical protein
MPLLAIPAVYWLGGAALTAVGIGGAALGATTAVVLTDTALPEDPAVLAAQADVLEAGKPWFANPWVVGLITLPIASVVLYKVAK